MMYEDSQPGSFWRPYLDILPASLNTPIFWNAAEVKELAGSTVVEHIGEKKIKSDYTKLIVPLLQKSSLYTVPADQIPAIREKYFSYDQYRRFGSLIMAYSFSDDSEQIAMVPMADMLNHRTGCNNARLYFDQEDDSIHEKVPLQNKPSQDDTVCPHDHTSPNCCKPRSVEAKNSDESAKEAMSADDHKSTDKSTTSSSQDVKDSSSTIEHVIPPAKKAKRSERDYLHMRTRRDILPNEELFNTYGTLPDSELLRKYGYVEELGKNRWNDVEIPVSLILSTAATPSICGWDATEIAKRKKFIKTNQLVDSTAALMFYHPQGSFGPYDPLEADEAVQGGLTRDVITIAKIFAASSSDWALAETAILQSRATLPADDDNEDQEEDAEDLQSDEEEAVEENKETNANEKTDSSPQAPSSEAQPPKRGGDLIHIADPAKLSNILKQVIQARIDQYGPNALSTSLERLNTLPHPSQDSSPTSVRLRCALIVKIGEIQLLNTLIADAERLSV